MNGPDHFTEGVERLRASDYQRSQAGDGDLTSAIHEALMGIGHFLAALTASHAAHAHPQSNSWDHAINQPEKP
ncbi:hypothetical protein [Streptomyces sp. LN704]|uniref:hypothetical protein n=1 Tax=Streptomyces sp. LN704 TaxID=3112982 RepID=UPI0037220624